MPPELRRATDVTYGTGFRCRRLRRLREQRFARRLPLQRRLRFSGADGRGRHGAQRDASPLDAVTLAQREQHRHAEVEQEKEKLRRFVAGLINDKGTYAAHRCVTTLCADEPYGVFEYGAIEDLDRIDGAKLDRLRGGEKRCVVPRIVDDPTANRRTFDLRQEKYAVQRLGGVLGMFGDGPSPETITLRFDSCD